MSVNPPEGTLTIENSHLDVKGNVSAVALKLGTLRLTPSYGLDAVANVSNSTTHTLELSNATTGLVTTSNVVVGKDLQVAGDATVSSNLTVSGNATVTGDLNVSGALGILDAIYPVGTVIDRATAITDTHLNGKYKAFLAAPDQEWQLVSSPSVAIGDVSFLVHNTLSANYNISAGDSIAWNGVKTNIGGGFQTTGTNINKFVAPVSGNYMFGVYISHRDTACELTLYVDGVATRDIMAGKGDNRDSTYNVLVPLSANNVVDLRARIATLTIYSITTEHSQNAWWGFNVGPGTPAITNYSYKRTV